MNRLIYMDDSGVMQIDKDLQSTPEFTEIYKKDKHGHKDLFRRWLTYLYYAYKRNGVYSGMLLTDRKKRTVIAHLNENEDKYKDYDELLKDCIKIYMALQYDEIENMLLKVIQDADSLISYLQNIPFYYIHTIDQDGAKIKKEIPNTKEKIDAMKSAKDILVLKQELEKVVNQEMKSKTNVIKRKFEDG